MPIFPTAKLNSRQNFFPLGTSDSLKKSTPPLSEPPKSPARTEPPRSNEGSTYHAGFVNKGNTCYSNSILQVLSVIPALWSQLPSESSHFSPLVKSISLNMPLIKRSSSRLLTLQIF